MTTISHPVERLRSRLLLVFALALFPWCAASQVPALINYQGRIAVRSGVFDGTGHFKFALVDPSGAIRYWGNAPDANDDGQPDQAVAVEVTHGLYAVLLGDTMLANMSALPPQVFTNDAVYLRVWFSEDGSAFEHLVPDQRVVSVGYAFMAATVPDGSITQAKLTQGLLAFSNVVGTLSPTQVPDLDAAKITSGKLDSARLPVLTLDAAHITTGLFDSARVPPLDASKVASGILDPARIPGLDASMIVSGTLNAARLPALALDASQITSGTLSTSLLPADVAYKSADLAPATAAILSQIEDLQAQINGLAQNTFTLPAGITAASDSPSDTALTSAGYQVFSTLAAPSWVTGTGADAPSARTAHAAVWLPTRGQMLVWGGQIGANTYSDAGALYRPEADEWQPVTTIGGPSPRRGHTMVVGGVDEVLVWGGFGEPGYLDTGGRLDLATMSWSEIEVLDAPSERDGHVAVWLNPFLVVWGGRNASGPLGDGALYHAADREWTALDMPDAPSARWGAKAVVAGDRVLVWGGVGTGGSLNTGGQLLFTPSGMPIEWNAISMSNAPSARSGHVAVWTGSRMIVWGGRNGGNLLDDGALYDPAADLWTPLPSLNAPSPRADAVAVWTGHEMLVFGGETASGPTQTGAAYDPAANRWRALSVAGDPVARSGATGVWTGSELVVFGGQAGSVPVAALRRLTPQPTWYLYRKP